MFSWTPFLQSSRRNLLQGCGRPHFLSTTCLYALLLSYSTSQPQPYFTGATKTVSISELWKTKMFMDLYVCKYTYQNGPEQGACALHIVVSMKHLQAFSKCFILCGDMMTIHMVWVIEKCVSCQFSSIVFFKFIFYF